MFSVLFQRGSSCWKHQKWYSYFENRYHLAKIVEKKRINFSGSRYCTLLFSRKENIKLSEVALIVVHCITISWMAALRLREDINFEILSIIQPIFTCLTRRPIKHWNKKQSLFKLIIKCTRTVDCHLASFFFINLEHLHTLSCVTILTLNRQMLAEKCFVNALSKKYSDSSTQG